MQELSSWIKEFYIKGGMIYLNYVKVIFATKTGDLDLISQT